jgi:3-oxoacyl-[acyl-carrier protein] reductase
MMNALRSRMAAVRVPPLLRVLVTGAGRGIGQAIASSFLNQGHTVVALDRDFSTCKLPTTVKRVPFDLRCLGDIPSLVDGLGRIDTLVNNAGVLHCPSPSRLYTQGTLGFSDEQVDEILHVNIRAPVALVEALAPQMVSRAAEGALVAGRVVNVGSVSAYTGHPDLWYGVSKAALLNATRSLATLLGQHRIIVNAVAPGPTASVMYDRLPESRKESVMRAVHSGRPATPEEVAGAVLWLGTHSPIYVNGATVDVNDGSYPR